MTGNVLARRYAGALIDLCLEGEVHEEVGEQLGRFGEVFEGTDLKKIFLDPSCTVGDKLAILDKVADGLKLEKILRNFLKLLIENKRMGEFRDIRETFGLLLDERVGRVGAEVVLSYEPEKGEVEDIRKGLEKATGKAVVMDVRVDPELIGGVVARVGSIVYDGSLSRQLENIKNTITKG